MKFLINNRQIDFDSADLPIIIHGADGLGASHFSISLIAYLLKHGHKIVFLTLLPAGTNSFVDLCPDEDLYILDDPKQITDASNHQAVLVKSGSSDLCAEYINRAPDIEGRVIFIKNAGSILNQALFDAVIMKKNVILSSDFTQSDYLSEISKKHFATKIIFSELGSLHGTRLPKLNKYEAFLISSNMNGVVSLED